MSALPPRPMLSPAHWEYRSLWAVPIVAAVLIAPLYGGIPVGPAELTEVAVLAAAAFGALYVATSVALSLTQGVITHRTLDCATAALLVLVPIALARLVSDVPLPDDPRATTGVLEGFLFVGIYSFARFVPWSDYRTVLILRHSFRLGVFVFFVHFVVSGAQFGFIGFANHKNVIGGGLPCLRDLGFTRQGLEAERDSGRPQPCRRSEFSRR